MTSSVRSAGETGVSITRDASYLYSDLFVATPTSLPVPWRTSLRPRRSRRRRGGRSLAVYTAVEHYLVNKFREYLRRQISLIVKENPFTTGSSIFVTRRLPTPTTSASQLQEFQEATAE